MPLIVFGLGTNLGKKQENIKSAIFELEKSFGSKLYLSKIYTSKPLVKKNAPSSFNDLNYLNCAIAFETKENPILIIKKIKEIEALIGRESQEKWAPRIIDIDILIYLGNEVKTPELKIPHSELMNRDFALIPLIETLEALKIPCDEYKSALSNLKNFYLEIL